jgi:hypothetical protein
MFFNNFLLYIANNKSKQLSKTDMIDALTKPLIPIEVPLEKLK